ncbi:hypothetical protein BYT27DRAFT_7221806 [Phlegmacium glaucopus]|nr:hypothetical protein BYT27DRAFT_7221806 [Phlegmacium glaucopus]
MVLLLSFQLPLPPNRPPSGYDMFLGKNHCVICGEGRALQHCYIIRDSEPETWSNLKDRHWIPSETKALPQHEPHNGLLMCANHHIMFNQYDFFICFFPDVQKFVLVNYSQIPTLEEFHGKAIALDVKDYYAPFPSLFIIHELRVRGYYPFEPTQPNMPNNLSWQDWILTDGVFDNVSNSFKHDKPSNGDNGNSNNGDSNNRDNNFAQLQFQVQPTATSGMSSGGHRLALDAGIVAEILAATHAMPSWKACQVEGTSWAGTAEENMEKYVSDIGIEK